MSNLPLFSHKGVTESINLYSFVRELYGEAALISSSAKNIHNPENPIIVDDTKRVNRYAYLNYTL
jgi:hypothetical protein